MKRSSSRLSFAVVAILVAACSSGATTAPSASPAPSTPAASASQAAESPSAAASFDLSKATFAFDSANTGNFYHISFQCGIVQAAKDRGVQLKVYGQTPFGVTQQMPVVQAIAATNPNVLIIGPTDTQALVAPLKAMQDAGTKVILYDSDVADQSVGAGVVTADNFNGGILAADTLGQLMGGKGTVLPIDIRPGVEPVNLRTQGFQQEMKAKFPDIKVLDVQYDEESPTKDASIVNATIAAHPELTAIMPAYNEATVGAVTALKAANLTGKYKIVTFDADPTEVQYLKDGDVAAVVNQTPYAQAAKAMDLAIMALEAQPISQRLNRIPMQLVTKDNLSDPAIQKELYAGALCTP